MNIIVAFFLMQFGGRIFHEGFFFTFKIWRRDVLVQIGFTKCFCCKKFKTDKY